MARNLLSTPTDCHIRAFAFALVMAAGGAFGQEALPAFRFAQLCDPQLGMGGYEHDVASFGQSVTSINALNPDFVVICGDLVNTADEKSFADFVRIKRGFSMPVYCAAGNHDVSDGPSLARYRQRIGEDYYAVEHKGRMLVVVNTQLWKTPIAGESEKHDAWVRGTLERARDRKMPIIVAGHFPLYITEPNEAEEYFNLAPEKRAELLELFVHCGVVAYISGHAHRTVVNEYQGMELVSGPTTSKNFDEKPSGFTLWTAGSTLEYSFVELAAREAPATAHEPSVGTPVQIRDDAVFHTTPNRWSEPRVFHTPFEDEYAQRIVMEQIERPAAISRATFSPNGAYSFVVNEPDFQQPGPWNTTIFVDNERDRLLQIKLLDRRNYRLDVSWINEKLLFVGVWWGRVLGTDIIVDIEREEILYREMKHDGSIPFQQWSAPATAN
jgi:predicted phosphodiesterase